MLSRCISRGPIQSGRLFKSLFTRDHHVIACASTSSTGTEKPANKSHKTFLNKVVLNRISVPYFGSKRNFSLTPTISASAVATAETNTSLQIPDVPSTPTAPLEETVVQALAANGEPTFASLGLGGYSPIGLLQNALEYLHVSMDLPWYVTIALSTIIIRTILTPVVVITQRNAATMRNVMPEMQEIQNKITEARQMGNSVEYAQCNQELMQLMKSKGFNPMKNMLVPIAQAPIFISYFIGIRRMVNAPVESMQTGGALWFTDLTMADPYFLLPLITCGTLALTIHLGTDGANVSGQSSPIINYIIKGIPVIIFPFIMNFPSAMVVYWASSNFCSLIQGAIFRIPRVRTFFNIPQLIKYNLPPKKKQSVVQNVKGAWSNLKLSREIEDRRRLDQINFEKAGTGPLVRTYKFDPTKMKN
ncbi:mitochondrial inner membrane protein OXA1L isoform X2 [Contarinia nasturtii]|uniref:mitochondrial inner membrane protein OXA1L isoform X2 n=1 Tax=Contarinia nasturtii TaxID=265458 RepID=UPI0012D499EA|nr:mitochondrial inner membrane protein OXA1L isoform X2 [Contarinia nasturtii]